MTLVDAQPVVLITGISASGKSTIAELLARRFSRGVHVKGDVFRRMVVSGRHEMTSPPSEEAWSQLRLRYRLGAATADAYHEAGFSVVVQDVVLGPALTDYCAAIRSRPLVLVVLTPRADVVARREAERAKTAYREDVASIEQLDRALRQDTPSIGLWLDNSDQQPAETIDEILERALEAGSIPILPRPSAR
ncbi:MAG TPA: AAA family ATPase [Acidimicrobiia bacterium]|nr:AAA family ATPase [Acidimicrobiia bacterium]